MSKTIIKYPLSRALIQDLFLPQGAKSLCVRAHDYNLFLYVLADIESDVTTRTIRVYSEGQFCIENKGESLVYIDTAVIDKTAFHVFETVITNE